jgi:hypothetical protein
VSFPSEPVAIKAGLKVTASRPTTLKLSSGGNVGIDPSDAAVAAHIPKGASVTVPPDQRAATVTADVGT